MKLSDTQLVILNAACQRDDRIALPLPASLKGGAARQVVASMINKGLLEEVEAGRGQTCWSQTADGDGMTLIATDVAFAALGIEAEAPAAEPEAPQPATSADTGASANGADHDATGETTAPTPPAGAKMRAPREGTKQAELIAMLSVPEGATIAEIVAAIGWQPHTVRGAIAGALKKKLGLTVTSEKVDGRGRAYFIAN